MPNKSKSKYNLSATELEIMEYLWGMNKKINAAEILNYFNENKGKDWKKQTLNTFLVKLIEKGALQFDKVKNKKYYFPSARSATKVQHIKYWTRDFIAKTFDDSLNSFLCAFTGGASLDEKSYNELQEFLKQH